MKLFDKLAQPALFLAVTPLTAAMAFAQDTPTEDLPHPVVDALNNAGIIGYFIILVSIVSLALIIENFVNIKREKLAPPELIDELEALFEEGSEESFQQAAELCESERNYFTNIVGAGLGKLGHHFETILTSVREMQEEEAVKLFQKVGYLSLIAATAPMIGLLGTVTGMFITFGEIAAAGGGVSPATLASGIKLALVTTILGLTVAIPVSAFFFFFRNRVVRSTIEVNAIAEDLFERFRPQKG